MAVFGLCVVTETDALITWAMRIQVGGLQHIISTHHGPQPTELFV